MTISLLDIPGLGVAEQKAVRIKALCIDGKSPALHALAEWEAKEKADYRKIMKVLRLLGVMGRIRDEKKVKQCSNPAYAGVYEARADNGKARLMFFYDKSKNNLVICTNSFWKGSGNQDTAFKHCHTLKQLYFNEFQS